ncbi:MAG: hypothetical protein EBS35_03235 [Bacteroidetes bacterium]|nr:hypothetical protein [Bacteroidota bacterium]
MHDLEPFFRWIDDYSAAKDERSPFFQTTYNEFYFENKIYNYLIHPQWDDIGSETLYIKILWVDYDLKFCIIEFLGEWNDCIEEDCQTLKRNIIDKMLVYDIVHFILIGENILTFHSGDDDYYQEWIEDISEEGGWVALLNLPKHVYADFKDARIHHLFFMGTDYNTFNWRVYKPTAIFQLLEERIQGSIKSLPSY